MTKHRRRYSQLFTLPSFRLATFPCIYGDRTFCLSSLRPAVIPAYQEEHFEPVIKPDQWLSHCDSDLEELGFHDDSDLLQVRDPDGASGDESPGGMDDIKPGASLEEDSETMLSAEDVDLKDAKRSKMRYRLLSCIRPARLSVRRKPKKGQTKKSDTTHLVKEI